MNNPYTSTIEPIVDPKWKSQIAIDTGRLALLIMTWLVVTYAVSLPSSKILTRDSALIALSPLVPIGLLASAIAGETISAILLTIFTCPIAISVVVVALGLKQANACLSEPYFFGAAATEPAGLD